MESADRQELIHLIEETLAPNAGAMEANKAQPNSASRRDAAGAGRWNSRARAAPSPFRVRPDESQLAAGNRIGPRERKIAQPVSRNVLAGISTMKALKT